MKFHIEKLARGMKSIHAETSRFTVTRLEDGAVCHRNTRPRKDSRFYGFEFLVWDNERNEKATA